jgi:hypothetical protein
MFEAEANGAARVIFAMGTVHRLEEEVSEAQLLEALWLGAGLRVNELELIAGIDCQGSARFRTDANPVDASGGRDGAVGLDCDFETAAMERVDDGLVELEQRLATGHYGQSAVRVNDDGRPALSDRVCEILGVIENAAMMVNTDEIGIAEAAGRA